MNPPATEAMAGRKTDQATGSETGLFVGAWRIGTMMPGAPLLTVHLTFTATNGHVAGIGQITQAVNPPLDITSRIDGDYTYLTVMPDTSRVLVTGTGYPMIHWPPHGGVGPVLLPNLQLRLLLESDWQSGTATFQYVGPGGSWQTVESATAEIINSVANAGKP